MLHAWNVKHRHQRIDPYDAFDLPLQLVGLDRDEGAVQGPLWESKLHSAKVAKFLEDASTEEPQVDDILH